MSWAGEPTKRSFKICSHVLGMAEDFSVLAYAYTNSQKPVCHVMMTRAETTLAPRGGIGFCTSSGSRTWLQ